MAPSSAGRPGTPGPAATTSEPPETSSRSGTPGRTGTPGWAGAVHALARGAAALRGGRALHTRGQSFLAAFRVVDHPDIYLGIPVLDEPGELQVPVRLSKGASLPGRLPDALGLAIRLPCGSAPDGDLDLLLTTTGWPRFLPFPSTGFASGVFSTLVSYRHATGRIRFLAVPAEPGRRLSADPRELVPAVQAAPLRFVLGIEGFHRRPLAYLTVHTPFPEGEAQTFDPVVNSHPALQLHGWLRQARAAAYAGSRLGRSSPRSGRDRPQEGGGRGHLTRQDDQGEQQNSGRLPERVPSKIHGNG
ncbi:hypothetical protein [Planomonospora venezuelensis]|uniref:Phosphodiesterase n=1 Tax=Planomonospora venezuelensis TaxID=1999 RepID=A0A841DC07_PLAVE|nr:hypothetical protein [Planomonospora venezuelensis]MBB5965994.1 hypothetical protein [Planomonospora venezuelensis]GIN01251.1 hypothetical protein Pve01_29090 [Planomonospora venezuelensis]